MRVSVSSGATMRALGKISSALTASGMDPGVRKAVLATKDKVRDLTPKGWTGATRAAWEIRKQGPSKYMLYNRTKTIHFLDGGTKAHGPVRAQKLFIPLTIRAGRAGAYRALKNKSFVRGRDYVLANKVRGIRPLNISKKGRDFAVARFPSLVYASVASRMR